MTKMTETPFIARIRLQLTESFDSDTSDYIMTETLDIAQTAFKFFNDDQSHEPDLNNPNDLEMLDEYTIERTESSTFFYPLPASIANFSFESQCALFYEIFQMLITYHIFHTCP